MATDGIEKVDTGMIAAIVDEIDSTTKQVKLFTSGSLTPDAKRMAKKHRIRIKRV